jgi:hypothetical protein
MGATPEEKKKRLHEDFDIAMTEEFESEVRDMCNLSRALVDQGIEQGMKQGVEKEKMSLAQMMIEEKEPVDFKIYRLCYRQVKGNCSGNGTDTCVTYDFIGRGCPENVVQR